MSPHAEPSAPAGARSRGTYFRRPGTLLLPISIRIPVLADRTAGQKVCSALLPRPPGPDWQNALGG